MWNKNLMVFLLCAAVFLPSGADAKCENSFINPITDINWNGIFPVKIGGVELIGTDIDTPPDNISSPICLCGSPVPKIGISASFWEPARLVETVKDPYCFTTIGTQLANPKQGFLAGGRSSHSQDEAPSTFQQAHWYIFPVWAVLDLFLDMPCLETGGFDIAYMTEIDPLWNSDLSSFILNPEALLFGNPAAQLACVADSVASNAKYPLDPLFWCMGSWGGAYPLTGHINSENYIQANAGLGARMIYKLGRESLLWDTGSNVCGPVPTPIWIKSHYRMHIIKPVRGSKVHPIGRSGLIWSSGKNPPFGSRSNAADNFLWMIFRKQSCCIYLYP
jgi:conjugal transfer pilus assembly protein TraU